MTDITDDEFTALYRAQSALTDARVRLAERRAAYETRQVWRRALRDFTGVLIYVSVFALAVWLVVR